MTMRIIETEAYKIEVGALSESSLNQLLEIEFKNARKLIIVDNNTLKHCFPHLINHCPSLSDAEIIEVESGEVHKNIDTCTGVWNALAELEITRNDLIINLGGGVIGDMGGFIAATYKRGTAFIQIPTTLLSQVDASVGGKLGVDLQTLKNLIGVISNPLAVYIDDYFLRTLPKKELLSGLAEIIKHGLIADSAYWEEIVSTPFHSVKEFANLVPRSLEIKSDIVKIDPYEKSDRKKLNFGHTIGHAIESYSHESALKSLLHGEAIAIGMICESYLSYKKKCISKEELESISTYILSLYSGYVMNDMAFHRLVEIMKNDKKNSGSAINFTLLKGIGNASIDNVCSVPEIEDALRYYQSLLQ